MTPADLDALIARLLDVAEHLQTRWPDSIREALHDAAAALADCREKLAQMAEVEGRADQVCRINDEMHAQVAALRAENRRLRGAILWALGYSDFPDKPTGKGRYWWRTELAQRAAIGDGRPRGEAMSEINDAGGVKDSCAPLPADKAPEPSQDYAESRDATPSSPYELCARIAEAQPFYPDTKIGMRQQWVKEQIAAKIRAADCLAPRETKP